MPIGVPQITLSTAAILADKAALPWALASSLA
jgi:hypothetical protein